jgi:hypothetical protein
LSSRSAPGAWSAKAVWSAVSRHALAGDTACRARRGARPAAAPLATGKDRRGLGSADLGGAGDRQIAPDCGSARQG